MTGGAPVLRPFSSTMISWDLFGDTDSGRERLFGGLANLGVLALAYVVVFGARMPALPEAFRHLSTPHLGFGSIRNHAGILARRAIERSTSVLRSVHR